MSNKKYVFIVLASIGIYVAYVVSERKSGLIGWTEITIFGTTGIFRHHSSG